jgi:rhamnogalacturonyl hydrolase YesR
MTAEPEALLHEDGHGRRDLLRFAGGLVGAVLSRDSAAAQRQDSGSVRAAPPAKVRAILDQALRRAPESFNADWFGTVMMLGLLRWHRRGATDARRFSRAWLEHHLRRGTVAEYSGRPGRIVDVGGIPITTYIGQFALSAPCHEMAQQFDDERAKRICLDAARAILHQVGRNRLGMVQHDDQGDVCIPDTVYFAVSSLMIGYQWDPGCGAVFLEQAVYQLRTYIDTFLVRETGLAKTILLPEGLGKTYWTRASGWLSWAIVALLRLLPAAHPASSRFREDLGVLARGMMRVQDPGGGMHALLDDRATPLEITGTAMFAMNVHQAARSGWLPASVVPHARRAWEYVMQNVDDDGRIRRAYTGWAQPAEARGITEDDLDRAPMDWIPGLILCAADEMTT